MTFAYPARPDKTILEGSFYFPAGQLTFIVGRSGSGKSTIADLVVRFYEPTSGHVLIDSALATDFDTDWLRRNVTLVQQASTVFDGTFLKNVSLGGKDPQNVTRDQARGACETALLQSTLNDLPNGLDTIIGSHGHALSGGQRQRLALARAKLRDPPILILDEVTSGLDPVSAKMVMDAVRVWRRGKTTIIITHDVRQMETDDYLYVMDSGRIVEKGSYERLARTVPGFFYSLLEADGSTPGSPVVGYEDTTADFEELRGRSIMETWLAPRMGGQTTRRGPFQRMSLLAPLHHDKRLSIQPSRALGEIPASRRSSLELIYQRGQHAQDNRASHLAARSVRRDPLAAVESRSSESTEEIDVLPLRKIFGTVWPTLDRTRRLYLVLGILSSLVVAGLNPSFSYLFSQMLKAFWALENREAEGRKWAILLLAQGCVDCAAVFFSFYLMEFVGQSWVDALRVEALKRVMRQPKAWFDAPRHTPDRVVEHLDRDAEEARKLVGVFAPVVLVAACMILASVAWAMRVAAMLTLVVLACTPFVVALTYWAARVSDRWEMRCAEAAEATGAVFADVFAHVRVVRAFALERYFAEELEASAAHAFALGTARAWRTGVLYGASQGTSDWLAALAFWFGVRLLTYPGTLLDVGDITQVNNLLLFSIGTAAVMLGNIPQISAAKAAASQLLCYNRLRLHASHEHRGGLRAPTLFPVEMKGLRFSYPGRPDNMVLRNLDLRIDAGEFVAIAGPSGGGKSTILSLLLRIYEAAPDTPHPATGTLPLWPGPRTAGALTFAGIPASLLDTTSLRARMAYAPQDTVLFPGTVLANIVFGQGEEGSAMPEAAQRAERAARRAGAHDWIASLPAGYETRVGAGGLRPSGGQARRLGLARALARPRPALLVLDEPTAGLDAAAAEGVRAAVRALVPRRGGGGMSVVVVTHAREMMRAADRVVAVAGGVVAADGPYARLVAENEWFAELVGEGGPRMG